MAKGLNQPTEQLQKPFPGHYHKAHGITLIIKSTHTKSTLFKPSKIIPNRIYSPKTSTSQFFLSINASISSYRMTHTKAKIWKSMVLMEINGLYSFCSGPYI